MKKGIWIAALLMAVLPAGAQQVKCTVNGVSNDNGKKVYLIDRMTSQHVDSAVVKGGKFSLEYSGDKDALMSVTLKDSYWMTVFFNDGTPVTVNMNDSTLKGSPVNERLVGYDLAVNVPHSNLIQKLQKMSPEERESRKVELGAEMMTVFTTMASDVENIFKEESNTMIPVAFINVYLSIFGQQKLDSALSTKPVYASHPIVKRIQDQMAYEKAEQAKKNAVIGKQFIDLEEADVDGNLHKLSEYVGKGKWVLVDFWASWCGPCRSEMPNVVAAYEQYHARGFDIVGLSFDNKKEPWVKAIADLKMPWTHLSDLKGWKTVASEIYSVNSIPDNLLIDPQGKVVARGLRAEGLHAKLREIFK